jgi:hypothetical protein
LVSNGTPVTTTFNFNTEFKYFNESAEIDSEIVLYRTHIPIWDYSLNTSHMTDFRNYSLLENISNISDVQLSYSNINVTFSNPLNLSDANLTALFAAQNTWFNVSLDTFDFSFATVISCDFNYSVDFVPTGNSSDFNVTPLGEGCLVAGTLAPARYDFYEANPPVYDREILGEFWVFDRTSFSNNHVFMFKIFGIRSLSYVEKLNSLSNFYINELRPDIDPKNPGLTLFYYSGSLLNKNQTIELIN